MYLTYICVIKIKQHEKVIPSYRRLERKFAHI